MDILLLLASLSLLVLVAAVVWVYNSPAKRVLRTESKGWIIEVNIFGFFVPYFHLSKRYNSLSIELAKHQAKVKQLTAQVEREKQHVESTVKAVNTSYAGWVYDTQNVRHWRNLWMMPAPLAPEFLKVMEATKKQEDKRKKGRVSTYIPGVHVESATWGLDDLPPEYKGMPVVSWDHKRAAQLAQKEAQQQRGNRQGNQSNKGN